MEESRELDYAQLMLGRLQKSKLNGNVLRRELDRIVALILERSTPKVVILFGSAVTDSLTEDSDIDLALIFATDEAAEMARAEILSKGPLSDWPVDLLLVGEETFRAKCQLGGVYSIIKEKGKVLHPAQYPLETI